MRMMMIWMMLLLLLLLLMMMMMMMMTMMVMSLAPAGVFNWPQTFAQSCSAPAQSPVNIDTSRLRVVQKEDSCPRIYYNNNMIRGSFINNGEAMGTMFAQVKLLQITFLLLREVTTVSKM
ncbi:hypothetical protein DPMN_009580 [Dreissena polymorpha]|uniref:Uncharacterized protein n=1 Tax=Dreissena polymorpha TaxID=45954 RepID=A0A9D4S068_DREPO|nr:hypothetical protein DPMN_009580 [Dreissena polymorpha]